MARDRREFDRRRHKDNPHRKLYNTVRWKRTREAVLLRDNYLCQRCVVKGLTTVANVVNHITPAAKALDKFFEQDNLESVCTPCHNSVIQSEEIKGYSDEVGHDGFPSDDKHPFNR